MKHTIIVCDLCGGRIYRDGCFSVEEGAILVRAKELKEMVGTEGLIYSQWKRKKYHICPKCMKKVRDVCKGGANDD